MSAAVLLRPAWGERSPAREALLAGLVLAAIAAQMCNSMPTPALADMQTRLHTTGSLVGLAQALPFLLGGLVAVVVSGYADYSGRRRLLLAALAVTCAGVLLAALAPNIEVLIVSRVLQGASGAVFPLALRVLWDALPAGQFSRRRAS